MWPGVVGKRIAGILQQGVYLMTVLPFAIVGRDNPVKTENRDEELKPRSVYLPKWIWKKLDDDAERCGRSATKQLQILLTLCFDPEADIEINKEAIASAYQVVSHKRLKKAG